MEIKDKIICAYKQILSKDLYLLVANVNERSITHRLAIYLQELFPEYDVDCEYNRVHKAQKKIIGFEKRLKSFKKNIASDDTEGITVFPDIIIHHRDTKDNLVVIEAKKTSTTWNHISNSPCKCDECKLRAYKKDLGYQHAFFITFPVSHASKELTENSVPEYIKEIE